jgi:hypothetical protein
VTKAAKAGIRRRHQIGGGIGQRTIQIEDHRFHLPASPETCRKDV